MKHSQMHPSTMKRSKTWVYGPLWWIGCSRSEKLLSDFVARTFALIAPVQPVLHWLYFHNKTIPNAPKHNETHQNMSLWSYGEDRVRSLREILKRLRGTNFCINCNKTSPFSTEFRAVKKWSQIQSDTTKRTKTWVLGWMVWIGWICWKNSGATSWHELLH